MDHWITFLNDPQVSLGQQKQPFQRAGRRKAEDTNGRDTTLNVQPDKVERRSDGEMRSPAVNVLTHVLSACQSHAAQLTLDRERLLLLLPSITANPGNAQVETMKDDVNMA